jgi:hypothetical protein
MLHESITNQLDFCLFAGVNAVGIVIGGSVAAAVASTGILKYLT